MKQYKLAIFDFDGTLADSFPFFVSVFNQLAEQHRFAAINLDDAEAFRGYSARRMMQHVGMPAWKLPRVAHSFIGLMKQNSHQIAAFEGIGETLHYLHGKGVQLAIVTSNSRENVLAILGKQNMTLISHIECGASIFGKASRIARVLGRSGVANKEAVYIGDQVSDMEAARQAKVALGAVAWGYATIESLLAHRPELIFYTVADIQRIAR